MSEKKDKRAIRFSPDKNTLVWVSLEEDSENKLVGLAINESYKGVSAAFLKNFNLKVGESFLIAVGSLAPVKAELRWIKDLDDDLVRVGFELNN
ncbi:MAG: hypothetical protein KDD50_06470 [Bdellovibrionales bacterium]|nr:hypothetical protein [Bdellovibrionales bacterium]